MKKIMIAVVTVATAVACNAWTVDFVHTDTNKVQSVKTLNASIQEATPIRMDMATLNLATKQNLAQMGWFSRMFRGGDLADIRDASKLVAGEISIQELTEAMAEGRIDADTYRKNIGIEVVVNPDKVQEHYKKVSQLKELEKKQLEAKKAKK